MMAEICFNLFKKKTLLLIERDRRIDDDRRVLRSNQTVHQTINKCASISNSWTRNCVTYDTHTSWGNIHKSRRPLPWIYIFKSPPSQNKRIFFFISYYSPNVKCWRDLWIQNSCHNSPLNVYIHNISSYRINLIV